MNISFIGLGIMGSRMAANLLQSDAKLTVWNRTPAAAEIPELAGAVVASTLSGAVAGAAVVFSMLATPEAVEQCFFGKDGALSAMQSGTLWIDCSTVNPSFCRRAAAEANAHGIRFFDAPVAGSKPQAAGAQLSFFVGATAETIAPVQPFLQVMGAKVIPFSKVGQGAAFKMIVNMLLAQSMAIFSEAILLGESLGIDRNFLLDTVPNLPVIAPFTKLKVEGIRSGDYAVNFPLELLLKDLHLVALSAYETNQPLPIANLTKELYAAANKAGMGRLDFAAIHQQLAGEVKT